jgi:hypothetical protein
MTVPFQTPLLAAALAVISAAPVLAQTAPAPQSRSLAPSGGAAAVLPNTFDRPATSPVAPAPLPETPGGQVTEVEMAEAALRAIIGQLQAGDIDEALFTPDLAARLNQQLPTFTPLIQGYGALQVIEPQAATGGVGEFLVLFENAATQWRIGLEDGGLVAALLFREAPPESSEPETPSAP